MAGLLNVGEMGALALHVLVELAALRKNDPDARLTVQELAERLSASSHTLQKVTRRLIMAEMIEGTRGSKGGLRLTVDPDEVTMLQVIEVVEGRICSNNCMFAKRVCPEGGRCVFEGVTGAMERHIRDSVTGTTQANLREMAGQPVA